MKSAAELKIELDKANENSIFVAEGEGKVILVSKDLHEVYIQKVLNELGQWHSRNPILEEGLDSQELFGKLGFTKNEAARLYLENMLGLLYSEGKIRKTGNSWALVDHTVIIDPKTQQQLDWVEQSIAACGMENPIDSELEEKALANKIQKERLKMLMKYLGRQKKIVFYESEYLHHSVVGKCRRLLLNELRNKPNGINEKEFRLLIDGTKKIVQTLQGIFIEEGIIAKRSFFIDITEKGKEIMNK
jgi:hypothetical protein